MHDTPDILARILKRKREEVAERKAACATHVLITRSMTAPASRNFLGALRQRVEAGRPAVIAEIKKASPSQGVIREPFEPAAIARSYEAGGAACLSVLTDIDFFQGADSYLQEARAACSLPVLRKDFIVDPWQVIEARTLGADCILLIAACLGTAEMRRLHDQALQLGMHTLIEVHNQRELDSALEVGSHLIGINNRNLHTFEVDLNTTLELMQGVPEDRLLVTESGIHTPEEVAQMRSHGVHAFLVGEAFMRAEEPGERLAALFDNSTGLA